MNYNFELKTIDTPEKAYLLGQLYGDGTNICKKREYKVSMASINTDTDLYKQLVECFPFLALKTYLSQPKMIYIESYRKNLCLDLKAHGMLSNKVKNDASGEFHFPDLREDLIHHFIRGYFDADGCAYFPTRKRSRNNLKIEFGCATPNFLKRLKEVLDKNGIHFTWIQRDKKASNGKYYTSYTLVSSNRETSLKFADYIYKDATLYLSRKKDKCYTSPTYRPLANDLYGNCPYCGSSHIIRVGIRDGKRRLQCKNCFRRFTRPLPTSEVTQNE